MATVLEPQPQTTEQALSPEERLWAAIQEHVNPHAFIGYSSQHCALGQVVIALQLCPYRLHGDGYVEALSRHFGVPEPVLRDIWWESQHYGRGQLADALHMVRSYLGLGRTP